MELVWDGGQAAVLGILTLACFCRANFGFGDALLAMPVLVWVLGTREAAPLMAMVGCTSAVLMVIGRFKEVDWRSTWRLVLGAALGIPVGILVLTQIPERWGAGMLGLGLVGYASWNLWGGEPGRLESEEWAWPFGFIAGCLGGAWNTSGPPVVLFGTLRGWRPERFRSSLQGVFIPLNGMLCVSHAASGLWTPRVIGSYAQVAPLILAALAFGRLTSGWLSPAAFRIALQVLLLVLGGALVAKAALGA